MSSTIKADKVNGIRKIQSNVRPDHLHSSALKELSDTERVCFDKMSQAKTLLRCPASLYRDMNKSDKASDTHLYYQMAQMSRLVAALEWGMRLMDQKSILPLLDFEIMRHICVFGDVVKLGKQFCGWPLAYRQEGHEVPAQLPGWNYEYLMGVKIRRFLRGKILNLTASKRVPRASSYANCFCV
jgi:hypothetical protein